MILTKFAIVSNESYNVLPYNYGYLFHIESSTPVVHAEIDDLTRS